MNKRKSYDASYKLQIVLDSMRPDRTIEQVRAKYGVASSMINRWRAQFKKNAYLAFESSASVSKKTQKNEDPDYLKKVIGDLTVQNDILKKALSVWD